MTDLLRQEIATAAKRIVVKVGTRVLTRDDGGLDRDRIAALAEQIAGLWESGRQVVLVSSGAVGAGIGRLGLTSRPKDLAHLQAVAAVGQTNLIEAYDHTFRVHARHAAQILLTADDLNDRTRYLNVRNTVLTLLEYGAIPIVNENDTVAVDELMTTFGDNDRLAALMTNLIQAQLLIILSDVDGLYDGDPRQPGAQVLPTVASLDESIYGLVRDKLTGLSKGGMASKLNAARICTTAGENVIIAPGRRANVLKDLLAGENVGTLFMAQGKTLSPFKRWVGFSAQPRGKLTVDDGARRAVTEQGRSLLPIGVVAIAGAFAKGDVVTLCDATGRELARGLTNYSSDDAAKIAGLNSSRIAEVLGHRPYEEVVHRDNLVIVAG
ncbi:MAG: glutamate 5-kinase [Planctomycetales bacterium]|nr:glutamate 5-kinase [Planctomycetales bacterium]